MPESIPFIDLQAQRKRLGTSLTRAIAEAVEGGQWILGPQVAALENSLAAFAGVKHAIACANGTDALLLILRAWSIGPGDAVFVPSFYLRGHRRSGGACRCDAGVSWTCCTTPSTWIRPVSKRRSPW